MTKMMKMMIKKSFAVIIAVCFAFTGAAISVNAADAVKYDKVTHSYSIDGDYIYSREQSSDTVSYYGKENGDNIVVTVAENAPYQNFSGADDAFVESYKSNVAKEIEEGYTSYGYKAEVDVYSAELLKLPSGYTALVAELYTKISGGSIEKEIYQRMFSFADEDYVYVINCTSQDKAVIRYADDVANTFSLTGEEAGAKDFDATVLIPVLAVVGAVIGGAAGAVIAIKNKRRKSNSHKEEK